VCGAENCSDASIFITLIKPWAAITFSRGFFHDFAQWFFRTPTGKTGGAVSALDIRDYVSIAALRRDLCRVVSDFLRCFPHFAAQSALERFYFCESVEVTVPLGRKLERWTNPRRLAHLSHAGFYFHFISSR